MRKCLFILLAAVVLFVSCKKKPQTPQEMILGNWVEVVQKHKKGEIYIPTDEDTLAYEFKPGGICDFKLAYFDHEAYMNDTVRTWNRVVPYLGTATKYKLEHKILNIYDPSKKKWDQYKIKKLTSDSLFIDDTLKTVFVKKQYPDDESSDFDTVILSTGGCFGPCPGNDVVINKDGSVLFDGYYHVKNKGHYKGEISKAVFNKLSLRFRQSDYLNLKSEYPLKYPHGSSISVTFVKNGKILKTVKDDGTAPKEFVWAYGPLQHLEQQIELKRFKQKVYLEMKHPRVSFQDVSLYLEDNQAKYLYYLFEMGREVDENFDEKFTMTLYANDIVAKVKTDGRNYKFYLKDGTTHTIDIGFDFLKPNTNNKELHNEQNN